MLNQYKWIFLLFYIKKGIASETNTYANNYKPAFVSPCNLKLCYYLHKYLGLLYPFGERGPCLL